MYRVTGYFKEQKVVQYFTDVYDAIDFKDVVDAHYPLKVTFEKGVYPVRSFIALLLAAIVITVATFETAKRAPQYFGGYGRGAGGEHE